MLRILVLFYDVRKKLPIYFMFCFVELVKVVSMTPAVKEVNHDSNLFVGNSKGNKYAIKL